MRIGMKISAFVRTTLTAAVVGALVTPAAFAEDTENLALSASVIPNCIISSVNAISFGDYDVNATSDKTKTGSVSVKCTKGTNATIELNGGLNGNRTMVGGPQSEALTYELYQPNGTTVWGTGGNAITYNSSTNTAVPFVVNGKIPMGQDKTVGSYTDTVTATINF
jgi:spore coat protein U-like protein